MDNILEIRQLNCIYNKGKTTETHALKDITFDVARGECLGIIGESGSGKSTTIRIITRLLSPTTGSVSLDGVDINNISMKELYSKVQMVFQTPVESFNPRLRIGTSVGESLRNAKMSKADTKAKVEKLLTQCGLSADYAQRFPHELSGGECQRAAIARALAIDPKILICDEATSSLDVTVQKEIIELLNDIRTKRGKDITILFVSHDIALVQKFCDRVIVMNKGEIVEMGDANIIIREPKRDYTKKLIASVL